MIRIPLTSSHYGLIYPNGQFTNYMRTKIQELVVKEIRRVIDMPTEDFPIQTQEINKVLTSEDLIVIRDESRRNMDMYHEIRRPFWMKIEGGEDLILMGPDPDMPGAVKGYAMYFKSDAAKLARLGTGTRNTWLRGGGGTALGTRGGVDATTQT